MSQVPKCVFLTKGVGSHRHYLRSFELALRDAGIERCNLVTVSSILPPHCSVIPKGKGLAALQPGQITYCVMSKCSSNEPHRVIAASIGLAIPPDRGIYGYISEHHAYGQSERVAGDHAEDLAASMLASTLGIEFDEDAGWDEKEEVFRISDKIVRTTNSTQSAVVRGEGYTTVLAAAVFLMDEPPK